MDAERKTLFVTGAASGIGRATARLFAQRGWFVGLYDINREGVQALAAELGPEACIAAPLDVTRREEWEAAVQQFGQATGGRMHVLFNNAGIGDGGLFESVPQEVAHAVISVNLGGVVNGLYACLPLLKSTPGARVVNTASAAGMMGTPLLATYSATKHAVRALTEALSLELERDDIGVCDVMPWYVDTAILDGHFHGLGVGLRDTLSARGETVYPVELAAQAVWNAAHGHRLHVPVGWKAHVHWFKARWLPGRLRKAMRARVQRAVQALNAAAAAQR